MDTPRPSGLVPRLPPRVAHRAAGPAADAFALLPPSARLAAAAETRPELRAVALDLREGRDPAALGALLRATAPCADAGAGARALRRLAAGGVAGDLRSPPVLWAEAPGAQPRSAGDSAPRPARLRRLGALRAGGGAQGGAAASPRAWGAEHAPAGALAGALASLGAARARLDALADTCPISTG